ncbi:MAG: hypothetical protein QGI21_04815 [Candidatus Poseidoniaceae archaeon]|nr:hypothetical protein [Candidatus Poseidoniaceae archaeon]
MLESSVDTVSIPFANEVNIRTNDKTNTRNFTPDMAMPCSQATSKHPLPNTTFEMLSNQFFK